MLIKFIIQKKRKKENSVPLWLLHTTDADETKLSCLVGGVNNPLGIHVTKTMVATVQITTLKIDRWEFPRLGGRS